MSCFCSINNYGYCIGLPMLFSAKQNQIRDDFVHYSIRNQLGLSLPSGAFQPNKIVQPNLTHFTRIVFFVLFPLCPRNFCRSSQRSIPGAMFTTNLSFLLTLLFISSNSITHIFALFILTHANMRTRMHIVSHVLEQTYT